MTTNPFEGFPERLPERIDLLIGLIAADWKRTGPDQRFFQYLENLTRRLGFEDAYMLEDHDVIQALWGEQPPRPRAVVGDATAHQTDRQRVGRTPAQEAAARRRVRVEAARLRCELDAQLGRETPQWVIDLAEEKP